LGPDTKAKHYAGDHSVSAPLDIGVSAVDSSLPVSYLPVFTLQSKTTFAIKTTDPDRALITGKWKEGDASRGRFCVVWRAVPRISTTVRPIR
jgi:hypothetical protein